MGKPSKHIVLTQHRLVEVLGIEFRFEWRSSILTDVDKCLIFHPIFVSRDQHVMLQRKPTPAFWKFIKGSAKTLFVLEVVGFAVSYGVWHRMNTNREFRQYMSENFPAILEGYYQVGELIGDSKVRQTDTTAWSNPKNKDSK